MKHQVSGFLISLLSHSALILLAVILGTAGASMYVRPVVIDLSILESVSGPPKETPGPPAPAPKAAEAEKTEPKEKPKRAEKIRQREKRQEKPVASKEVIPIEEQGPVPIAVDEVSKSQPLTEALPGNGDQSGFGTGSGAGEGGGLGGYGTGGVSADELRKKYLSEHFAYIKKIIQENITYPPRAQRMGWQGKVIIDFIILENGNVSDIKIAKSSGFKMLDDNVIKTVEAVAPFPRPPVKAELRVPITYRLE